jgi:PKD repeat protein
VGATVANPTHTYVKEGVTVATLTLKSTKAVRTCTVPIDVASSLNDPPQVTVDYPFEGGIYTWGDMIDFSVSFRLLYLVVYIWPSAKACLISFRGLGTLASACLIPACINLHVCQIMSSFVSSLSFSFSAPFCLPVTRFWSARVIIVASKAA